MSSNIDYRIIPVNKIDPNPWNPNEMPAETLAKIKKDMETEGVLESILVRPSPEKKGRFQIIDGEQRLMSAKAADIAEAIAQATEKEKSELPEVLTFVLCKKDAAKVEKALEVAGGKRGEALLQICQSYLKGVKPSGKKR